MKTDLCPRVTNLPPVAVVEQVFARPREPDVGAAVSREMHKLFPDSAPRLDQVVGLTMPSRGIRDIHTVVRAAVEFLKPRCKEVRVLTAMGTHGGGTADGERAMARSRGVTEASVGAPFWSVRWNGPPIAAVWLWAPRTPRRTASPVMAAKASARMARMTRPVEMAATTASGRTTGWGG